MARQSKKQVEAKDVVEVRTPSNEPQTAGQFDLSSYPITPAAHQALKATGMAFDQPLRRTLIRTATEQGRQLTLEEVGPLQQSRIEAMRQESEERAELYDAIPDEDAPKDLTCGWTGCTNEVEPNTWNVVRRGTVLTFDRGPLAGKPIRAGNFAVEQDEFGNPSEVKSLCRQHTKLAQKNGVRTYPYARASQIVERTLANQETLKRLGGGSRSARAFNSRHVHDRGPRR